MSVFGPNVKKLIAHKMALQMIPNGIRNPLQAGLKAIMTPGETAKHWKEASLWVEDALAVIKTAPDNPYGEDDEVIAGMLLAKIAARKQEQRTQ